MFSEGDHKWIKKHMPYWKFNPKTRMYLCLLCSRYNDSLIYTTCRKRSHIMKYNVPEVHEYMESEGFSYSPNRCSFEKKQCIGDRVIPLYILYMGNMNLDKVKKRIKQQLKRFGVV